MRLAHGGQRCLHRALTGLQSVAALMLKRRRMSPTVINSVVSCGPDDAITVSRIRVRFLDCVGEGCLLRV